ncbi:MAG: signal recognition particle-docking protein FtsY [Actinomycetota bacterium]
MEIGIGIAIALIAVIAVVVLLRSKKSTANSAQTKVVAPTQHSVAEAVASTVSLSSRFARTSGGFAAALKSAFGAGSDDAVWQGVEEALLMADVGVSATEVIIAQARKAAGRSSDPDLIKSALKNEILNVLNEQSNRELNRVDPLTVVLIVGVNGAGKTTSVGKIAYRLTRAGLKVVLGAADTFRAAAADQLDTWATRTDSIIVKGAENSDPAAVAFDAVASASDTGADVVLIDTAGRLHTKQGLMDELSKIRRVVEKKAPVSEVLLVLDATTGQNGLQQAKVFAEAVDVTGIVLTKLDGTAKGGVVIAVQQLLQVPVKFVGIGETAEDLIDFDPEEFVDALFA